MKKWRDASTVIIAVRNIGGQQLHGSDYKVLTARRNVESRFMPNSHVFPGGALDTADSSVEWEKLHRSLGFTKKLSDCWSRNHPMQSLYETPPSEHLPRSLSLRIAAIRETFEECGVLLCRRPVDAKSLFGSFVVTTETAKLQTRLTNHELSFHELCRSLQCFPDVWALHEGRNWLTPENLPKRFDTAFFLVLLEHTPDITENPQEVADTRWSSPAELLSLHEQSELWLPPPQAYEINKMSKYHTIAELAVAANKGQFRSEQCFLPKIVAVKDGLVFLLPGDSAYGDDGAQYEDDTLENFRNKAQALRRYERPHTGPERFLETADNNKMPNKL